MLSCISCPATCELCGQWMPGHSNDCPRSGVHPSQWSINTNEPIISDENNDTWQDYHSTWLQTARDTALTDE